MQADLSIVIVTYNSAHVIVQLLDSLPGALVGLAADVVVVDNGSSDGTAQLLAERTDCRLVRSANTGYAGGINVGVAATDGAEAILALNPDVSLAPEAVPRMLTALRQPGVGIVAPRITKSDGALYYSLRREPSLARTLGLNRTRFAVFAEYINEPREYDHPRDVDWALGAVLLFSRECYDAVGGWYAPYFLYSEETEFCLRARDLGYATRYEPAAGAMHIGGQSGQSAKTHTMRIVNRVRCDRRRHGAVLSWLFFALTLLREVNWIPRAGNRSRVAAVALLRPSTRPPEIGCSEHVMPS